MLIALIKSTDYIGDIISNLVNKLNLLCGCH